VKLSKIKKIILLGPPGSGKGTQAKKISQYCKIAHISTGEILRKTINKKSKLAKSIKSFMNKGELVPDSIIFSIIRRRLKEADSKKGFLFDGFPRNIDQAITIEKILGSGSDIKVFNIEVKTSTLIKRLSKRRVCRDCGDTYHLEFQPPKKDKICNKCGGELYQRDDDKPAAINNRLRVYNKQSKPLIQYYRKKGFLISINGEGSESRVFLNIKKYLI